MSSSRFGVVSVATVALAGVATALLVAQSARGVAPDLILTGGLVRTPSGWAEAMAIRSGVIVAVGESNAIAALRGSGTRVVELGGSGVFPGLHDVHVHSMFAGMEQFACAIPPGAAPAAIAASVKACLAGTKTGEWIVGGNWVAAVFAPGQQTRGFLDAIAPVNPVMLNDEAHHSVWANSRALELAGITRTTPNPGGGIIERDPAGEPTGLLRENATALVERIVPPASDEAKRAALTLSSSQMLSYGITSYTEASVRDDNMATLSALSGEGVLKQHVRGCIVWTPGNAMSERLLAERASYAKPRFATDCVKMFMDGVPTESHTGAMLDPYEPSAKGGGNAAPERGMLMIPQAVLNQAVSRFDRQGLHVKFHAAGDAAVRAAIDAVVAARRANGWGGPMHDVGHSTFVALADIARVRDAHMAFEYSPYIWYPTPIAAVDILAAVGAERMKRWVPIKDGLDSGALVTAGSDWSVVPSVNPWLAMETMVTRQLPGGSIQTLGEQERVTLEDAFRIFTENGALLMGHRDRVGTLEPGMHADVIVTATNPFTVPITEVHSTKVTMTFIDGEQVFDAASPPKLTAR